MKYFLSIMLLCSVSLSNFAERLESVAYGWGQYIEYSALTIDTSGYYDIYVSSEIRQAGQQKALTVSYWFSESLECSAYEVLEQTQTWYIEGIAVEVKQQCKTSEKGDVYIENRFEPTQQALLVTLLANNSGVTIETIEGSHVYVSGEGFADAWESFVLQ